MKTQKIAMNIVNQLYDLAEVSVDKRQAINDQADEFVSEMLVEFLQSIVNTKEKPKEGKFSDSECNEIMQSRGYTKHHTAGTTTGWTKALGDSDNPNPLYIFADVNRISNTVKLSGGLMKMLLQLHGTEISFDHPRFEDFEKQLARYCYWCSQSDIHYQRLDNHKGISIDNNGGLPIDL